MTVLLTHGELLTTSRVVKTDVAAWLRGTFGADSPLPPRELDPFRVYRLMEGGMLPTPDGALVHVYDDVVAPETHTDERGVQTTVSSVRLVPVGREDLARRWCAWTAARYAYVDSAPRLVLVEQSGFVACRQLAVNDRAYRVLCDDLQFVVADVPVVTVEAETGDAPALSILL